MSTTRKCITRFLFALGAVAMAPNYRREASSLREGSVGGVNIHGSSGFIASVSEALLYLKQKYPYGYRLVQRYVRGIVESGTSRGMGTPIGVIYQKTTPEGNLSVGPARYAAHLVRYAIARRKLRGFYIWRSPRSELTSLRRELKAMEILNCDRKYFHRPLNLVLQIENQLRNE
jgi:hypothetical protein